MIFSRKHKLFWQGFLILVLSLSFNTPSFAARARVLSDEELDSVHAQGLFFDFDVSFGELSDLVGTPVPNNSSLTDTDTIHSNNPNINYVNSIPDPEIPPINSSINISPTGGAGYNVVVVDDFSQQYLSSMVNVNAAGSIVPILMNITINIDSSVENLSNSNSVDLTNFYQFTVQ